MASKRPKLKPKPLPAPSAPSPDHQRLLTQLLRQLLSIVMAIKEHQKRTNKKDH